MLIVNFDSYTEIDEIGKASVSFHYNDFYFYRNGFMNNQE